ncbi:antitoxin Xre/MbcA/ParS toxin-binding domain-containing protein [uncultured Mucilaginibacter sp.]|uniref:type II RES/Xre toxin-antitoxin system antitoxin n=1 Tax=uncultured Mucilaginibacter sp. TaxID=797541 RepID=UPI00261A8067|nr:antitoxin Xre/MbcA/ParS toxin-binding domain-containing protein [uncultured Mucilaginibacter sp.]
MPNIEELLEQDLSFKAVDDKGSLFLINAIRQGIGYSFFDSMLQNIPFSFSEWSAYLNLSERTLQRYKKENKPFQAGYAERILEIRLLYKYGVEVFEVQENFDTWLNTKSIALGGVKPKDLLDTTFGINLVRDELTRIEHGVLA